MTEFESSCARLRQMLSEAKHAVFFGGAGVSTDSGLADFRSQKQGLYNQPSGYGATPEEILTPAYMLSLEPRSPAQQRALRARSDGECRAH